MPTSLPAVAGLSIGTVLFVAALFVPDRTAGEPGV
jgi:hypothetical protein